VFEVENGLVFTLFTAGEYLFIEPPRRRERREKRREEIVV
jgi:hypothetical protein